MYTLHSAVYIYSTLPLLLRRSAPLLSCASLLLFFVALRCVALYISERLVRLSDFRVASRRVDLISCLAFRVFTLNWMQRSLTRTRTSSCRRSYS